MTLFEYNQAIDMVKEYRIANLHKDRYVWLIVGSKRKQFTPDQVLTRLCNTYSMVGGSLYVGIKMNTLGEMEIRI